MSVHKCWIGLLLSGALALGGCGGGGGGSGSDGGTGGGADGGGGGGGSGAELFQDESSGQTPTDNPEVAGGFVYWLNKGNVSQVGLGQDRVQRKPLTGGDAEDVAGPASIFDIEADANNIYWVQKGGVVWAKPHAGGTATQLGTASGALRFSVGADYLLTRGNALHLIPKAGGMPQPVAFTPSLTGATTYAEGDVFYVLTRAPGATSGTYTGTVTIVRPGQAPAELVTGITNPGELVGVEGQFLYLTGDGTLSVTPRLLRVDKAAGGTVEALSNPDWGFDESIISDGTVYGSMFVDEWAVFRYPLAGGAPVKMGDFGDGLPDGFAVSADHLYWVFVRDLYRAPLR